MIGESASCFSSLNVERVGRVLRRQTSTRGARVDFDGHGRHQGLKVAPVGCGWGLSVPSGPADETRSIHAGGRAAAWGSASISTEVAAGGRFGAGTAGNGGGGAFVADGGLLALACFAHTRSATETASTGTSSLAFRRARPDGKEPAAAMRVDVSAGPVRPPVMCLCGAAAP